MSVRNKVGVNVGEGSDWLYAAKDIAKFDKDYTKFI